MKVFASVNDRLPLAEVGDYARRVERIGFDALKVPETTHDGFVVCTLALEHTTDLAVVAAVVIAFPRSPMITAYAAWDLHRFSHGRFGLGLGLQIEANIRDRFSSTWGEPVAHMREYLLSLRAIFASFQHGVPLSFEGHYYKFTRLQPFFNPGPAGDQPLPIYLGGVNPSMCQLAGELSDGLITHASNSHPHYLDAVALPNLRDANEAAGVGSIELISGGMVLTGRTVDEVVRKKAEQRQALAFLYSTPAYWRTLELNGLSDLGPRLRQLTREKRWDEMTAEFSDEMVETLVPVGTYDDIGPKLREWYGGRVTALTLPLPADPADDPALARVVQYLQAV